MKKSERYYLHTSNFMLAHSKSGHVLSVIGIIIFALYALLILPGSSSAVTTNVVGSLAVELYPNAPSSLDEVRLTYNGINNAGSIDLSDWSISNENGYTHTFPQGSVLLSGDLFVLCSDISTLSQCTDHVWSGDVWDDVTGTIVLRDQNGQNILAVPYSDLTDSSRAPRDVYERYASIFDANDKVELCHTTDAASYKLNKANAAHIINEKGGHKGDVDDVIPSFFYNFGSGLGYFDGQNWNAASQAFLASGCN